MRCTSTRKEDRVEELHPCCDSTGTCGGGAVRKFDSGKTVCPSPSANPSSTPSAPSISPSDNPGAIQTVTVEVWFTKGDTLFEGKRTQSFTVAVGRAALTALLAGPSAD